MQFNAGIVVNKFDVTGETEVQDADIITATTGGITATCKANFTDLGEDVDNAQKNTAELMQIEDYDCTLAFTALNVTTDVIKLALGRCGCERQEGHAPHDAGSHRQHRRLQGHLVGWRHAGWRYGCSPADERALHRRFDPEDDRQGQGQHCSHPDRAAPVWAVTWCLWSGTTAPRPQHKEVTT